MCVTCDAHQINLTLRVADPLGALSAFGCDALIVPDQHRPDDLVIDIQADGSMYPTGQAQSGDRRTLHIRRLEWPMRAPHHRSPAPAHSRAIGMWRADSQRVPS